MLQDDLTLEFTAPLWRWEARRELWTFVSLPPEVSEEIRELSASRPPAGFGSVRVSATIAVAYAILGWLAALAVDGRGTDVSAAHAALNFLLLGLFASLIGSLRSTDGLGALARRMARLPAPSMAPKS